MASGTYQILVHAIFSTINNRPKIPCRAGLDTYINRHLESHNHQPVITRVEADHIHLLFFLNPDLSLTHYIKILMFELSHHINRYKEEKRVFWDPAFYVMSCDARDLKQQIEELQSQDIFHQTVTYREEMKAFLENMLETSIIAETYP